MLVYFYGLHLQLISVGSLYLLNFFDFDLADDLPHRGFFDCHFFELLYRHKLLFLLLLLQTFEFPSFEVFLGEYVLNFLKFLIERIDVVIILFFLVGIYCIFGYFLYWGSACFMLIEVGIGIIFWRFLIFDCNLISGVANLFGYTKLCFLEISCRVLSAQLFNTFGQRHLFVCFFEGFVITS